MLVGPLMSFVVFDGLLATTPRQDPTPEKLASLVDLFLQPLLAGGT
jgi:hypothetical protein